MINIYVAYAETAQKQHYIRMSVLAGTSVKDVLAMPEIRQRSVFADEGSQFQHFGIYGKKVPVDYVLQDGDRLEIYRELVLDPMSQRRQKQKINKKRKTDQ